MFQLAEALHKTVGEIMEMSASEFMGWVEYYKIKEKRSKRNGKRKY
jgi:hypothetical protein